MLDLGPAIFVLLFTASSLAAFIRGDKSAKVAAVCCAVAAVATRFVCESDYTAPENGVLAVDLCLTLAFAMLATASQAQWLVLCTAASTLSVLTHLTRIMLPTISSVAYFDAAGFWSYPIMLLMLFESGKSPAPQLCRPVWQNAVPATKSTTVAAGQTDELLLLRDLISIGNGRGDSENSAKRLIDKMGSLGQVLTAPLSLLKHEGVQGKSAELLRLCRRIALLAVKRRIEDRPILQNTDQVVDYLRALIPDNNREQFRVMYLNEAHHLIHDELQGLGTATQVDVSAREILASALRFNAAGMILTHNHPSGCCTPSDADLALTEMVVEAARPLGIAVLDHIIISRSEWSSMRLDGRLRAMAQY